MAGHFSAARRGALLSAGSSKTKSSSQGKPSVNAAIIKKVGGMSF
jgi:hypothetical protein